ncbi:Rieske domain-containing protein isoform X1 [Lingula anatina]|uniref:Rieske domain-containing protein isoform X1 n=1 Tax=Lingula anatina TaxID=7574 RepID=A0A1S3K911_LINAN|nr:Rieske domain-containing protein isoform X1 [Lingula anatina]|eukprot:XP_013418934.1 Rieske domain-containing protein isoform X1 [Lingula anatina]
MAESPSAPPMQEPVFVGRREDLVKAKKTKITVNDREIIIVYSTKGKLHAIDALCYHQGGSLFEGDIEELGGRSCIVCPFHKYSITLSTGECIYEEAVNPRKSKTKTVWKTLGRKQRIHRLIDKEDDVYVELSDLTDKRESDYFYTEEGRNSISIM